jgi:Zn-dependent M32 family carboxypeptidase
LQLIKILVAKKPRKKAHPIPHGLMAAITARPTGKQCVNPLMAVKIITARPTVETTVARITTAKPTVGIMGTTTTNPPRRRKKQPSLSELLGLTGEVAEKFEQLRKRLHETVKAIAESDMSNEDKAVKIRVAHKKYRDALKELLSEEQLAKLRLIHLKRAESHNKNKKHHHHFGPFIAKALKLTEEQLKKLGAVRHHACEKRYKVLSNKNLSEEEKKVALKEINEQVRARTAEILTEEQLAMLKKINAKARKMSGSNGKKKSTGNPE